MTNLLFRCAFMMFLFSAVAWGAEEPRIFSLAGHRLILRFEGTAAEGLHQRFLRNYKYKVKGIVDGKDVACFKTEPDIKPPELACAFAIARDGGIRNVFWVKPETDEDTYSQSILSSSEELARDLKAGPLRFHKLTELKTSMPRTATPLPWGNVTVDPNGGAHAKFPLKVTGALAEFIMNFLSNGQVRHLSHWNAQSPDLKTFRITRKDLDCQGTLLKTHPAAPKSPTIATGPSPVPALTVDQILAKSRKRALKSPPPSPRGFPAAPRTVFSESYRCFLGFNKEGEVMSFEDPASRAAANSRAQEPETTATAATVPDRFSFDPIDSRGSAPGGGRGK